MTVVNFFQNHDCIKNFTFKLDKTGGILLMRYDNLPELLTNCRRRGLPHCLMRTFMPQLELPAYL